MTGSSDFRAEIDLTVQGLTEGSLIFQETTWLAALGAGAN
jgi:hypothetical protein